MTVVVIPKLHVPPHEFNQLFPFKIKLLGTDPPG